MADKENRGAFWSMFILLVLVCFSYFGFMIYLSARKDINPDFIRTMMWQVVIFSSLLVAEALYYWIFRRKLYVRRWVRLHILLTYIALIGVPLVSAGITYAMIYFLPPTAYFEFLAYAKWVRAIVYWFSLVVGHLFFIGTIVKSLARNKAVQPNADNSAHILDEFAE